MDQVTQMFGVPENFPVYAYNAKTFIYLAMCTKDNTVLLGTVD